MSKPLKALGLMSGTSLDGIDVAMLETDGETIAARGPCMTVNYDESQRHMLKQAMADATHLTARTERPGSLLQIEREITRWHADAVDAFLEKHGLTYSNIDVIGFHGQTVIHRPDLGFTVQLGDGQTLANSCECPIVWDLRANDMAHGGQGAPLVPVYHRALINELDAGPSAVVNIGGVANVTWIGRSGELVAFDTGPGNALLDDWMKHHTGSNRDEGGSTALAGQVDEATVAQFLGDGFFEQSAPKSLDRDTFASYQLTGLSVADGAATLVEVTARAIAASARQMPTAPRSWIICGGGRHNQAIMKSLQRQLPDVKRAEDMGWNGDAVEAEAWAFLAVRSLKQLDLTYPGTTGVRTPVSGGLLSKPV